MRERSHEEIRSMMHEVSSKLDEKKISPFDNIRTAVKRAKYFTKNISIGGPCSPTGKNGLSIPVRNALWLLDLEDKNYKNELHSIEWMAQVINKWIDNHMIEGDEEAIWALGAFLSRIWFDVEKLEC